jgi:hypothetical protein
MNLIPDELKTQTFPCPKCGRYISSEVDACKFCSMSITSEMKNLAIAKELNEKKNINLNRHKNTMIVGVGSLVIGIFMIISPVIEINLSGNVNVNCLTPVFIIGGIVIFIKGFIGYREEKRRI